MSNSFCIIARKTLFGAAILSFCAAQGASAQTPTRTRLNVTPSPSNAGATIRLSAEVDNIYGGELSGMLEFRDGETLLASRPLSIEAASMSAIAAGGTHTCALTAGGGVRCWGTNFNGELGDGTQESRSSPVQVSGLEWGVVAVASGVSHSCSLRAARQVACWGNNAYGQIGDGTEVDRFSPVTVAGLFGAVAIAAGGQHTCALHATGRVKCWGLNAQGQLGDGGASPSSSTPVIVSGLANAVAITAGANHTCAITAVGAVKCWGSNRSGQLGAEIAIMSSRPVDVSGLASGVTAIAAGASHTCALVGEGTVKCWGSNNSGQLGDATRNSRNAPVDVASLESGAVALAAGASHTCAIMSAGAVKCWGRNFNGALGDSTQTDRLTPVSVVGLTKQAVGLSLGVRHTCVLSIDRRARCWGAGGDGQLGDGTSTSRLSPGRVALGLSTALRARATFETNALALGVHTLSATHAGDPQHFSSTGQRSHTVR